MAGSTPMILIDGLIVLAAMAMPAIRPDPPIGTISTSSSGACSSISMAIVPWPARTCSSLNG